MFRTGTDSAAHPGGAGGESGLDNGPIVDYDSPAPFNASGRGLQNQYSAGQTGLFLMDTKATLGIAQLLGGRDAAAAELQRRFDEMGALAVRHLWNASAASFLNRLSATGAPITRQSPNQFYPLLAGPAAVPEAIARAAVGTLTNNTKFAVWTSGAPPAELPPQYARPLVQWWARKRDSHGHGDTKGPHALCCQPACNSRCAGRLNPSSAFASVHHLADVVTGTRPATSCNVPTASSATKGWRSLASTRA